MDADQTYNSIVFAKNYDVVGESKRSSSARSATTPDVMIIRNQDMTFQSSKRKAKRSSIRIERHDVDAAGAAYVSTSTLTFEIDSLDNSTDIATLVATTRAVVADADHIEDVLNGEL
jgi:hypothetical protein